MGSVSSFGVSIFFIDRILQTPPPAPPLGGDGSGCAVFLLFIEHTKIIFRIIYSRGDTKNFILNFKFNFEGVARPIKETTNLSNETNFLLMDKNLRSKTFVSDFCRFLFKKV